MNKLGLIFLATCAASITGLAAFKTSDLVALRFVTANDAFHALEQRLGADAASAVRSVDSNLNRIALDGSHPQAAKVREFLASFDRRPAHVMVSAVVTRHVEATDETPAHDEVIARPHIFSLADKPIKLSVPGEHGSTDIELRITYAPADKEQP